MRKSLRKAKEVYFSVLTWILKEIADRFLYYEHLNDDEYREDKAIVCCFCLLVLIHPLSIQAILSNYIEVDEF